MNDYMVGPGHNSRRQSPDAIAVRLPGVLIDLFPGAPRRLDMNASTVSEMIDELNHQWPGMRDRLCDSTPRVRKHINIFVDGVRLKLDALIPPGSEVFILTAISGG